ncbi:MAG: nucleotidyltransferase family protein [Caldilineales bacterium]|nr:nucleotidyltransferase family protein [Caldilineales bacterium]
MSTNPSPNQQDVIERLRRHETELQDRFGVASLALFGSAARDDLNDVSDVDVVVSFDEPATLDRYFDLKFFLQDLLGREVDLATEQMVKPRLRTRIASEIIYVS